MIQTIKDFFDDVRALRPGLQIILGVVLMVALAGIYFGVSNIIADFKIKRLESQNFELNRQAQSALEKAAKSETNAANEAIRAASLESQLKALETKTTQSDEKYKVQSKKSDDLRGDLRRVRTSSPANVGTETLERRLKDRYRQSNTAQ